MKQYISLKKIVCSVLVLMMALSQEVAYGLSFAQTAYAQTVYAAEASPVEVAEPENDPETVYDLVVVVVDQSLDNGSYLGLKSTHPQYADKLKVDSITQRALRYGDDIRDHNDLTDVKILLFDKQKDTVQTLAAALENLYINGDGPHNNKLSGVVLIGDIPLPVVNKNGNRYVSMFPYTDFVEKAYVYNEATDSYEKNPDAQLIKPEAWHGVMRPPSNNVDGYDKLAAFLDKNHLYYEGVNEFAQFDRKMFFGDLVHEEEQMNAEIYKKYLDYLESWEDLIYQRYNKFWAAELMAQAVADLPINENNPMNQPQNGQPGFGDNLKNGNFLEQIPDIYTKNIIDQNLPPYFRVFTKYIAKVNDFASNTGRYNPGKTPSQVHSAASLISIKDEYTKFYLRGVNDALERKVNQIVEKIEEPLPLLKHSTLSGKFLTRDAEGQVMNEEGFKVGVEDSTNPALLSDTENVYFKYHYTVDSNGKFYINGVDGDLINSAKQCSVYLGSTKSSYYDENLNFNPKSVGGEYSILTRALRSDNTRTILPLRTTGVNTRILQPSELVVATGNAGNISGGVQETGEIVENNLEYGISAFLMNPYNGDYKNPWDNVLDPGDVVVNVNGKNISHKYTFEMAVEESYKAVEKVIKAVNDKKLDRLKDFQYKIATYVPAPPQNPLAQTVEVLQNPTQIMNSTRLKNAAVNEGHVIAAVMSVEYYRGNQKKNDTLTFSVVVGDKNGNKIGSTSSSNAKPSGNPPMLVILSNHGHSNNFYDEGTDGAIFSLYENDTMGFGGDAYDSSAGCNAKSTQLNSDRCFGKVATMPVLDPAGALMPIKVNLPGGGAQLKFPENASVDYQKHVESYQFPTGKSYEDVDEIYLNACFDGLPAFPAESNGDSNPFSFVLDIESKSGDDKDINIDFYGKLLNSFGAFLESNLSDEPDYEHGSSLEASSDFNPKESIWLNLDKVDASEVVINNPNGNLDDGEVVTLKDFSDRYGLFDGKDNNDNGIRDYEWRDEDEDGVYETKFYDFEEANSIYGIPSGNLQEIARKMLSNTSTYTVPYGVESFPYDKFDRDITLEVEVNPYKNKSISSMIIHNEPTDHTIYEQVKSQTAFSLPTDNPRYVAFQTAPESGIEYPEPVPINGQINVQAILDKVEMLGKEPSYYPGEIKKVNYLNVFDESVKLMPDFKNLVTQKADELVQLPYSYKIFGANVQEGQYSDVQIKDEILKQLNEAISAGADNPPDGFDLTATSEKKLADALEWKGLNIDDKHQYVLKYYLNGDKDHYAYVNDATVFPAQGSDIGFGYEAAYLLLNGDKDYVEFAFNKDLPEETDGEFNPLSLEADIAGAEEGEDENEDESGGEDDGDDEYEFVWWDKFLKELEQFIEGFSTVPKFTDACSYAQEVKAEISGDAEQITEAPEEDGYATISSALTEEEQEIVPSKKVVLHTYVVSEIEGFYEAKDLLEAAASAGSEDGEDGGTGEEGAIGQEGGDGIEGGDGGGTDGSGDGSESKLSGDLKKIIADNEKEGSDKNAGNGGDGAGTGSGDGSGGASVADGVGDGGIGGESGNSGEETIGGAGGTVVGTGDEDGTGSGDGAGVGSGDGAGGQGKKTGGASGDTKILESTPVEETTLKSKPVDFEDAGEDQQKDEAAEDTDVEDTDWARYFLDTKYYQRFLPTQPQANKRKLLAAVVSDQNPFENSELEESKYIVLNDSSITADGKSIMKIEAEVKDKEGNVEINKKHKVRFRIENVDVKTDLGKVASFEKTIVDSETGVAVNYMNVGKRTGKIYVIAEVMDGSSVDESYLVQKQEVFLVAGVPVSLTITSDSNFLVANNESKTQVKIILKDEFGNKATNAFNQLAVFSDSALKIDPKADLDGQMVGTQINTLEGEAKFDLFAGDKAGKASLIAVMMDYELGDLLFESGAAVEDIDFTKYTGKSKTFDLIDKNKVSLELKVFDVNFEPATEIIADGASIVRLGTRLLVDGKLAEGYSGPVKYSIVNKGAGKFVSSPPEKLLSGQLNAANLNFRSSKVASEVEILVEVPGFVSGTFNFKTVAGAASKIELTADKTGIYTKDATGVNLTARLLDENNNPLEKNSGTVLSFTATEATKDFVSFSNANVPTIKGEAKTTIYAKSLSGVANLKVQGAGLKSDNISLKITKKLKQSDFEEIAPRTLYMALLGGTFGKIEKTKNLAETLLYGKGQVQAITALTASVKEKKRLAAFDSKGKMAVFGDDLDSEIFVATQNFPYQKLVLKNLTDQVDLLEMFLVPKTSTPLLLAEEKIGQGEGIYVKNLSKGGEEVFEFIQESDAIYIKKGEENFAKIDKFGRVSISNDEIKISLPGEDPALLSEYFSIVLTRFGANLAQVVYKQNFNKDLNILKYGKKPPAFFPGIYVMPKTAASKYALAPALSGSSSDEKLGAYLLDLENEIDGEQLPANQLGMGYDGKNKQMLYFAAGNSLGESSLPYSSDAAITFGDPMIRLKVEGDLVSKGTGYSKDIGKPIFNDQKDIKKMVPFDYNGDGYEDLLLAYEDGLIRLLENEISNKRFADKGNVLNLVNGIYSLTKIDVNNDSFDDLIVGTKESCTADEECISLFENQNGALLRKALDLSLNNRKAYEMKADDMDKDGCEDLVVSDSSGKISIFYNKNNGESCLGLNKNAGYSKNYGFTLENQVNIVEQIFVNYAGMEQPNGKDPTLEEGSNAYKFIQFILQSNALPANDPLVSQGTELQQEILSNPNIATKDIPPQTVAKEFNFIHIKEDGKLGLNSTKQAVDVNGESVELLDKIDYLIVLKNTGNSTLNNLMISDSTPASLRLIEDSLECMDNNCPDQLKWEQTGQSLRSHIIKGISVPANGQRIIKYSMVVEKMPQVKFDTGNNFGGYPVDNYRDILVKPEINPEGIVTYLYSTGARTYAEKKVLPNTPTQEDILKNTFKEQDLPDPSQSLAETLNADADTELSDDLIDQAGDLGKQGSADSDYNGCVDSWQGALQTYQNGANAIAAGIENTLNNLRCNGGGCLPIPYNYALYAPDGAIPGFPIVNIWSSLPWFVPFSPSISPASVFRAYVSPTLTLGIGTAVCGGPGPGHLSPCYAFAVPGGFPGVCDGLNKLIDEGVGAINSVVSKAKNAVVNSDVGLGAVISDGEGAFGDDPSAVNVSGNYADEDSPFSAAAAVNVKIPGFPSVITNWIDKETDEIYNKLLDLPDFYLILPDIAKFGKEIGQSFGDVNFRSFHDFAYSVSQIPFINIEGREIVIKVPAISQTEIEKYKYQAQFWLENMQNELKKYYNWDCDATAERKTICDKILLDITNIISSVKELLDFLDQLANLPRDILTYKNAEAKYATQIICYMDAIMNYTGGYIKRQEKIIRSWMKAVQDVLRAFKSWQVILDLVLEYQQSCDQCKNDRFSKLGLLLQLFVAIPDPPVIPMPKWPDVVVDLSNIKTGVNIVWPDVVFRPQPILLPDIPVITLPDILPEITIKLDYKLDLPDLSKIQFMIPNLPDLPPLPLPKLPDLPRPPKIPQINDLMYQLAVNLKPIFKILCLIKNGLVPVPESALGTEIETLTQPNIKVVIPIIKNLALQWPPIQYSYVKEVRINAKLNFDIDTTFVYIAAENLAEIWNKGLKAMVDELNKYTRLPYGQILSNMIQKAVDDAKKLLEKEIQEGLSEAGEATGGGVEAGGGGGDEQAYVPSADDIEKELVEKQVTEIDKLINEFIADLEKEDIPDSYTLVAEQSFLENSHPLLNRSIAQVQQDIIGRNEDFSGNPHLAEMANFRDRLIVYTKNLEQSNRMLAQAKDYGEFSKTLIASDENLDLPSAEITDESEALASTTSPENSGKVLAPLALASPELGYAPSAHVNETQTVKHSFFGEALEKQLKTTARTLLAGNLDFDPESDLGTPATVPIGFYVIASNNLNENVLNYTSELGKNTQIIFDDVDKDEDVDIIFSMGGDVYLKSNHKEKPDLPKGDLIGDIFPVGVNDNEVSDFINPGGGAVNGLKVTFNGNKKVDVSWQKHSNNTYSYEVIFRESIYGGEANAKYKFNVPVSDLNDKEKPNLSVEVENGNYYVSVYAINGKGERSLKSETVLVAPQICADQEAPFPVVTAQEGTLGTGNQFEISIFKELVIDAKNSFDVGGGIASFEVETLPYTTDQLDSKTGKKLKTTQLKKFFFSDKDPLNDGVDKDPFPGNDKDNPVFRIGPFVEEGDIGTHEFMLHVTDESGKKSSVNFSVKVFVPKIDLDDAVATSAVATGKTSPPTENLPFKLMRDRYIYRVINQELKLIPRLDILREATTDQNGEYLIEDFNLEEMILVENSKGQIVAEINPKTGNVKILVEGYAYRVNPAKAPTIPTSIDILNKDGEVLGSVYLVANSNVDVEIHQNLGINAENHKTLNGVNVDDLDSEDNYSFVNIPASDPSNPGAAVLINKKTNKVLLLIDTGGNIQIIDDSVKLSKKQNDHKNEPLIIEVKVGIAIVGEVYISPKQGIKLVGPNDVPYALPHGPTAGMLTNADIFGKSPFEKLKSGGENQQLAAIVEDLYKKGILDDKDNYNLKADDLVKRKEFVKVLINMLCIIPREEAYKAYAPGKGYDDVEFDAENLDQYYVYIKEGTLLGLVEGYKGETGASGLFPFKPEGTITRAEATKIILEALELKEILDLSKVTEGEPWYVNYMKAAQDLTPYFGEGIAIENNFIITPEEAKEPNEEMTFEQLLLMVTRVLDIYNCFEEDTDGDGLSDFCEAKYQVNDPEGDEDYDELDNIFECKNGLNPLAKDSDGGGVNDGDEMAIFTNPLNKEDDQEDEDEDGLSSLEETVIYKSDPFDNDTDDGGLNDGQEVLECKNPLDKTDDIGPSKCESGISGIYVVPSECNTCPCISTFLNKAELMASDVIFPLISKYYEQYYEKEPKDKTHIFFKGNEVKIKAISK